MLKEDSYSFDGLGDNEVRSRDRYAGTRIQRRSSGRRLRNSKTSPDGHHLLPHGQQTSRFHWIDSSKRIISYLHALEESCHHPQYLRTRKSIALPAKTNKSQEVSVISAGSERITLEDIEVRVVRP